ncbi:AAA family ATPase [Catenuloplanes sp. NPDC051500]|uniref:AAA family ATPase n=1 Tax=Catenuloplanes sp. NPDC051500 TaxID=3363959 RepID=UPI0037B3421C
MGAYATFVDATLVERDAQTAQLEAALADCLAGRGGTVTITGGVATGKTELLQFLQERAGERGTTVLTATGYCAESDLALGVIGQLFAHPALPPLCTGPAAGLLAGPCESDVMPFGQQSTLVSQELWAQLQALSTREPVVIAVDDLHFADGASLQALAYFGARLRTSRVLIAVTESDQHAARRDRSWQSMLLRQPRVTRVRVHPLTESGTATLLGRLVGPAGRDTAAAWAGFTSGNPLLLRALAEDYHAAGGTPDGEPVAGEEYAAAVATCVRRAGPAAREVARALAVLGDAATPALLRQLLDRRTDIPASTAALDAAGVLHGGRYHASVARCAVLATTPGPERTGLHRRAAALLHGAGAEVRVVAGHLVDAGHADEPWAFGTLLDAARDALRHDDLTGAEACLDLASRAGLDDEQRVAVTMLHGLVEHRTDPATSFRRLRPLVADLREGRLTAAQGVALLRSLHLYGTAPEIASALRRIEDDLHTLDPATMAGYQAARQWLHASHPHLAGQDPDAAGTDDEPLLRVASQANHVLRAGADPEAIRTAELVLQTTPLDDGSWGAIQSALYILIYADRCDLAATWCDELLREATDREVTAWRGIFAATRAEIALRRGRPRVAARLAREALQLIPPRGWGVTVGAPLACLITAGAATGGADPAGLAVPDLMWRTRFGAQMLYARGRQRLALGRPQGALDDLMRCGRLLTEWGIDLPAFLPWRSDAVEALLQAGRAGEASTLAAEQLSRPSSGQPRTRGIALRALASTAQARRRLTLLRESADLLTQADDRYELARTLTDLGEAQHRAGQPGRAGMVLRQAALIADEEELTLLRRRISAQLAPEPEHADVLSTAERQVATLAATGRSNREIAERLYITVSTVEQHLTHAYRKLRIKGRTDLPASLGRIS